MKKYKWLSETIIGTVLCAVILTGVSFVSDTKIEQNSQNKDIKNNTDNIEYLQKTQNATHETVINIQYDMKNTATKNDIMELKDEIKNLLMWYNIENKRIMSDRTTVNYDDILGAENKKAPN